MSEIQLLHLNRDALLDLLSYCKGENTLVHLTQCHGYFKDLIESSRPLMQQLKMKIYLQPTRAGTLRKKDQAKFKICLQSKRVYDSVSIELDKANSGVFLKALKPRLENLLEE